MSNRGGLAVFVTSHGFGHLNRTVAVLNRIPDDVPIKIYCHDNLFAHWKERLQRPATFAAHVSDVGALNPAGNSAATDGPATLERAAVVFREAMTHVPADVQALKDEGSAAVLCDAPAIPLVAAKQAGIPGFLLANFNWADIYAPHARKLGGDAVEFVKWLRSIYRNASTLFRAEPALKMNGVAPTVEVGMVVTPGRDRKSELRKTLSLDPHEKIVYFYVGRYGQENLGWKRLETMKGIYFVGFHEAPIGRLKNLHVVSPNAWTGADLAASSDAIVAKAGYGTACEAMVSRTPMLYPPRVGFAEHRVLDQALRKWGGGVPVSSRAFESLRIESLLKKAFEITPQPPPFREDGASVVAEYLTRVCRDFVAKNST